MTGEPVAFLVDTNVISRGSHQAPNSPVERWIKTYAPLLRVSVITIAGARRGLILAQERVDRLHNRDLLQAEPHRLRA